uniref:Carboxylesterase type B domain-containing protein n=1 Tax=Anopheles stephensi TaxID=30069 RepID=A0A182Y732_ANOST
MFKLAVFVGLIGFVVAYDFQDSYYNELLLQDLLDDADEPSMMGRFRRSPADAQDDKCKRRYKCCNDANNENLDKIHEIKKQCFAEVRNKNKADGAYEPVDFFSCDRLNKTKMDVICAMECVGRKKEVVNDDGTLIEGKLMEFVKSNFAADDWQQPLLAGHIDTCVKEAKDKAAKSPREAGQCSSETSNFGYCMWRQMALACPKDKQVANKRCDRIRFARVALCGVSANRTFASDADPIVDLPGLGRLKGSYTKSAWSGAPIQQFLNVRYAEPPVGKNRFKAPIPAQPWQGVQDVSVRGRGAPCYGDLKKLPKDQLTAELEDCISLCVYTKDTTAKRPVAVYIHGGGFYSGSAAQHPPEYLLEKDIVLVVPQYRLGPLGFLSTKTDTIPGNAAILDVLLAFEWVQQNIAHFGGDPGRVTAVGQSAGAGILSSLLFSPALRESHFQQIILHSGAAFGSWLFDHNGEKNARDIARRAGFDPNAPLDQVEEFLVGLDTYTLLKAFMHHNWQGLHKGINSTGGRMTIGGPTQLFPKSPYEVMKAGGGRKNIPMLTGVVKDEGTFALVDVFTILTALKLHDKKDFLRYDVIEEIQRILGTVEVSCSVTPLAVKSMLDMEAAANGDIMKMIPGLIDLCGMHLIKSSVLRLAQYNSRHTPEQTFVYSFDYRGEHTRFGYDQDIRHIPFDGGVHHTNDLLYLFPYPPTAAHLNEQDTAMAKRMVDLWTSFIVDGVPKSADLPHWPPFNRKHISFHFLHDTELAVTHPSLRLTSSQQRSSVRTFTLTGSQRTLVLLPGHPRKLFTAGTGNARVWWRVLASTRKLSTMSEGTTDRAAEHPIVELPGLGKLKGSTTRGAWTGVNIYQFLNVRYAEPAMGERRFKPPVPVQPWDGVMDVSEPKLGSPVYKRMKLLTEEQRAENLEDCINLSVFTKDFSGRKPVIVYVHGGGFYDGAVYHYPPNYIMEKDVVLVVPQYRLGVLGFLCSNTKQIPGNAGVMDVVLAFEWVQKYISHFGGDPRQVTAMAQSSGAAMVSSMTYSPLVDTERLFNRLILQSGNCHGSWVWDRSPERNCRDIAGFAGFDRKAPLEDVERFLMQLDIFSLMKAFTQHYRLRTPNGTDTIGGARMVFNDPNGLFPENPYFIMRKGGGRKNMPLLTGVTRHDGTFAFLEVFNILLFKKLIGDPHITIHRMVDEVNQVLGVDDPSCTIRTLTMAQFFTHEQLASGDLRKLLAGFCDHTADVLIKGPVLKMAQNNAMYLPEQTYLYSFDYAGEHTRFGYGGDTSAIPFDGGVHHSNDLMYLFPYPPTAAQLNEQDTSVAKRMVDLWTSFAIHGKPEANDVPAWPPMNNVLGPYLKINKQFTIGQDFREEFTVAIKNPSEIEKKKKQAGTNTPPQ